MMNFLPLIYEDELFFSIISRYKQMCGFISKNAFVRDIYGKVGRPQSLFLPKNLNSIISNLPISSKITAEDFVLNNSLYPFFTAFLSQEKAMNICEAMVSGDSSSVERQMGISSSKVKLNKTLKYCPICFNEDMDSFGESWWRRLCQVPGVQYCLRHAIKLKESNVITTDTKLDYLCADFNTCTDLTVGDKEDEKLKELNMKYVNNVSWLLLNKYIRKDLRFIINFYIDKLRERGLASKGGCIYLDNFQGEFVSYYSHKYLRMMQSDIDLDKETNWVRTFVRNNCKNRSPLRHLLVLQFLGIDIKEFFSTDSVLGKNIINTMPIPRLDRETMRERWLEIVENNPGASRPELKKIGKGIYSWIFKHDREWFNKVTPKKSKWKKRKEILNWEEKDIQYLELVKRAESEILAQKGKPVRITRGSIRRKIAETREINNKKLVKTNEYIDRITEDITNYRIRKVKWAIHEMLNQGYTLTAYKIQLFAGFGGNNKEVKKLIEDMLLHNDFDELKEI